MNNLKKYLLFLFIFPYGCNLESQTNTIQLKINCSSVDISVHFKERYFDYNKYRFEKKGLFFLVDATSKSNLITITEIEPKREFKISMSNSTNGITKDEIIKIKTLYSHHALVERASDYILGMLLDVDASIYSKITVFDDELMQYLPENDRKRHKDNYNRIAKNIYNDGNNCNCNLDSLLLFRPNQDTNKDWKKWSFVEINSEINNYTPLNCLISCASNHITHIKLLEAELWSQERKDSVKIFLEFMESHKKSVEIHINGKNESHKDFKRFLDLHLHLTIIAGDN